MKKLRTVIISVVAFVVVFTIAGFFAVPPLAKHLLVKNLSEALHRNVSIQQIKFNPYNLTMAVKGFTVKEQEASEVFLSFDELFANIQAVSIFKWAVVVNEIKLTNPYIRVIRNEDGTYNFSDVVDKAATGTAPPAKKSQPIHFSINNITISGGSVDFIDTPKGIFHEITDINLAVPFVSNMKYYLQTYIQPRFSALVNGDSFIIEGKTKPFHDSLETELDINIKDLDLADYLGYVPIRKHFNLLSGALDLAVKISYIQYQDKSPDLEVTGTLTIRDINLADEKKNPLFKVVEAVFDIASVKPLEEMIHLASINIRSPGLLRDAIKTGQLMLLLSPPFCWVLPSNRAVSRPLNRLGTRSPCHFWSICGK
jgi:uncharacterized protein involved in outer membrane biogenesis